MRPSGDRPLGEIVGLRCYVIGKKNCLTSLRRKFAAQKQLKSITPTSVARVAFGNLSCVAILLSPFVAFET